MIAISTAANKNYLAKIVKLNNLRKHPMADRLQMVMVDYQNVITGMDAKEGDIYVYFPLESCLNLDFLKATNSFRDKTLNADTEKVGFFEKNGRVRAVKLRNEKSYGYLVPATIVEEFVGEKISKYVGEEFDEIGGIQMLKKYIVPVRGGMGGGAKKSKDPGISRLVDKQFKFHVDTGNLKKEIHKIKPEDEISISYKYHGSSFIISNVLVKKKLKIYEKFLRFLGVKIIDNEYDFLYSSRRVVKNEYETKNVPHYYSYDIWEEVKKEMEEHIPKGFTVYGEICGFLKGNAAIQKGYDYGCADEEHKNFVYRITSTNSDGITHELSSSQIKSFCNRVGWNYVHTFYTGRAGDLYPELDVNNHWHEDFIKNLERHYTDKKCFLCKSDVWEEGIVLRRESLSEFEAYKLKSWNFLEMESKLLDEEIPDIESEN